VDEQPIAPEKPGVFKVKDCALIAIATGRRAYTLKEFRDTLLTIGKDSIYYHFWGGLVQPRFEEREYNNDFASWLRHGIHDSRLAEQLAAVDPTAHADLEELRIELVELVEQRLDESDYLPWVRAATQFEFIRSQIVVFDTHKRIEHPREMAEFLPRMSTTSIFYHFVDARRRLPDGQDDFRYWLMAFTDQCGELCRELAEVDPYFGPLTDIRQQLVDIFNRQLGGDAP
jgi:hypothetical protein